MDRKIKVIRAMALEKDEFYPRYIVVDTETGEVVDDVQGWGGTCRRKRRMRHIFTEIPARKPIA